MQFEPRPYQKILIDAILDKPRVALWAGMGMGKTVSTLTALDLLIRFSEGGPALIIAPLRVANATWSQEVAKWDHLKNLRVSVITGTKAERMAARDRGADIYVTNYETIPELVEYWQGKWPYKIVVADEATRLKGFRSRQGSSRAKALAKVSRKCVKRFVELTGTPAPNGLMDLWGQVWFLDFGKRLGTSMRAYQERWFRPLRLGDDPFAVKWIPMEFSEREVHELLSDITVKVNPEDWFDLDKPIVSPVYVTLPDKVRQQYDDMRQELVTELEDETVQAANAAVKAGKLLQIASGALYREDGTYALIHTEKIEALKSIVEEAGGMPILVAYQFKHEADRILKALPQAKILDKDPRTIAHWNEGRIPMLLAHPASCGHGLSLQDGGNILVFFSTGWNLEEHDQIIERIGPMRQKQAGHPRSVFVYNIIAKNTIDEIVQERIESKRDLMDLILEKAHD